MQARPRAHVRWFSEKQKRTSGRASPQQLVSLRLHEFAVLFRSRYSQATLPDDDSGGDDIEPVLHHLMALRQGAHRARLWLGLWAPWMTVQELDQRVADAAVNARPWTADQLAWRYRVTMEERRMLALTTIGAIDQSKAARVKARRERDRGRKQANRRAAGAKPRREYEADSLSRAKPWIEEGVSRRTWERRRKRVASPATA